MGLDLTIKLRKSKCKHCGEGNDEIIFKDLGFKGFSDFYEDVLGIRRENCYSQEIELPNNYEDDLVEFFAKHYSSEGEILNKIKAVAYDLKNNNDLTLIMIADW